MKKIVFILISLAIVIFLLSCATTYQKLGTGIYGGYSETRLQENVFQVSFLGNVETSMEQAKKYALYRCAEITIEYGYDYFVILESEDRETELPGYTLSRAITGNTSTKNPIYLIRLQRGEMPEDLDNAYIAEEILMYTDVEKKD